MYLTDEQIMLLEQLTYLTDDVADAAEVLLGPYDSVENLLQQFDDDALQRLEDPGNPDSTKDYTGGCDWRQFWGMSLAGRASRKHFCKRWWILCKKKFI